LDIDHKINKALLLLYNIFTTVNSSKKISTPGLENIMTNIFNSYFVCVILSKLKKNFKIVKLSGAGFIVMQTFEQRASNKKNLSCSAIEVVGHQKN
jgi:hypothetical protein